jgi:hypothetical protein
MLASLDQDRGLRSVKPTNVRLNLGRLVQSIASGTLTLVGAIEVPWTIPLAALVIWNELFALMSMKVSEDDACVIWALWRHADPAHEIAHSELLPLVNEERAKHGRPGFAQSDLDLVLERLTSFRCIRRVGMDPPRWQLRET